MSQDPERDDVTASATASASASAPASASAHYSGSSLSVRCGIAAARGWRGETLPGPLPLESSKQTRSASHSPPPPPQLLPTPGSDPVQPLQLDPSVGLLTK